MAIASPSRRRLHQHPVATIIVPDDADSRPLEMPAWAFTQKGFREWVTSDDFPENCRVSYLEGEILLDMSPETIDTQTLIKVEVGLRLGLLNDKEKRGLLLGDRVLYTHQGARISTEPDGLFVLWSTLESGRMELVPRKKRRDLSKEVRGTADWVLEIVSDSSVAKDTKRLRELYFKAGVPEYWLVDARSEELVFTILVRGPKAYVDAPRQGNWQQSRLFGRQFRLERKRGRLGIWDYRLHHRRLK